MLSRKLESRALAKRVFAWFCSSCSWGLECFNNKCRSLHFLNGEDTQSYILVLLSLIYMLRIFQNVPWASQFISVTQVDSRPPALPTWQSVDVSVPLWTLRQSQEWEYTGTVYLCKFTTSTWPLLLMLLHGLCCVSLPCLPLSTLLDLLTIYYWSAWVYLVQKAQVRLEHELPAHLITA